MREPIVFSLSSPRSDMPLCIGKAELFIVLKIGTELIWRQNLFPKNLTCLSEIEAASAKL